MMGSSAEGLLVGSSVGARVVGAAVGVLVGERVDGSLVGNAVGELVVGVSVGDANGHCVVGLCVVGVYVRGIRVVEEIVGGLVGTDVTTSCEGAGGSEPVEAVGSNGGNDGARVLEPSPVEEGFAGDEGDDPDVVIGDGAFVCCNGAVGEEGKKLGALVYTVGAKVGGRVLTGFCVSLGTG